MAFLGLKGHLLTTEALCEGKTDFYMGEITRYSVIQALLEKRMVNGQPAGALDVSERHKCHVQRKRRTTEVL